MAHLSPIRDLQVFRYSPGNDHPKGGNFLNYEITWDDAEEAFARLSTEDGVSSEMAKLFVSHDQLSRDLNEIAKNSSGAKM